MIEDSQRPVFSYFINVLKAREGKVKGSYVVHGIDVFALNENKGKDEWNFVSDIAGCGCHFPAKGGGCL